MYFSFAGMNTKKINNTLLAHKETILLLSVMADVLLFVKVGRKFSHTQAYCF
jgi:hypothetical protein